MQNIYNIFEKYQNYLKNYNSVDFDDLIILSIEILSKNNDLLVKYQKKGVIKGITFYCKISQFC